MSDGIMSEIARCQEWIEGALEYSGGTHTFKDIVDGILSQQYQFWPAERGCAHIVGDAQDREQPDGGERDAVIEARRDAEMKTRPRPQA